jgi:hypothetical protein
MTRRPRQIAAGSEGASRQEIINMLWNGEIGDADFVELGLTEGMTVEQVGHVLMAIRVKDGTL